MRRLLPFILAILFTNIAVSQPVVPTPPNLITWWPFCADFQDHSGNGYDLINGVGSFPSATLTTDRFGNVDNAFLFNGVNNMMLYPTIFPAFGNFTYTCWINPSVSQNSIILYNGNPNSNGFGFVMLDSTTTSAPGSDVAILFAGQPRILPKRITLSQWHHLAITKSGSTFQFYLDTVYVGSFVNSFVPPGGQFSVGLDYTLGNKAFDGKIDDISIYNRVLSFAEIKSLAAFNTGVSQFTLGNDTAICTNAITIGPVPSLTGVYDKAWNTGDTAQFITVAPAYVPGTKYKLTVSRPFGCTASDSIQIIHSRITVSLGNDTTFCAGNALTLTVPVTGATYAWNTGASTASIIASTSGSYSVFVDSNGCTARDTININVLPATPVNLGPDVLHCDGSPATLSASNTYASPVYLWGGFPILPSSLSTPTTVASTSGVYWLTVTDGLGCPGVDSINVIILYDTFTLRNVDTAICKHATVTGKITGIKTGAVPTYQWTPTTGMPFSDDTVVYITPDTSAYYYITATLGPCVVKDSFFIEVQPDTILVYAGGTRHRCAGDTIQLRPRVTPAWYTNYIYDWTVGTYLDDSTVRNVIFTVPPTYFAVPPAGDSMMIKIEVRTSAGCKGSDSLFVYRHTETAMLNIDTFSVCPHQTVDLAVVDSPGQGPSTIVWRPSTDIEDSTSFNTKLHPITSTNYIGYVTNSWGCKDTVQANIIVYPSAVITMPDSVSLFTGESYQINPGPAGSNGSNGTYFSWFPPEGLNDTSLSNPVAKPGSNTTYFVTVRTEQGCETTDSIKIKVDEQTLLAIPNAFAPGTGPNNKLFVIMRGVARLNYFRIFDRWGQLVFESTNINEGWDGTFRGKPQPFAVYVYEVEATTDLGKKFRRQGNVTLVR
jgi:gliding motility-associated-like protein